MIGALVTACLNLTDRTDRCAERVDQVKERNQNAIVKVCAVGHWNGRKREKPEDLPRLYDAERGSFRIRTPAIPLKRIPKVADAA